ncbi:MAG: hypothetical protein ABSA91_12430 [Acidimicrobiales bacterium]
MTSSNPQVSYLLSQLLESLICPDARIWDPCAGGLLRPEHRPHVSWLRAYFNTGSQKKHWVIWERTRRGLEELDSSILARRWTSRNCNA